MDSMFINLIKGLLRFDDEPITAESNLFDLGLDSMRAVELLFLIEDTYDITLTDEQLSDESFRTAGSLWAVVAQASQVTA